MSIKDILPPTRLLLAQLLSAQPCGDDALAAYDQLTLELEGWNDGFVQYLLEHERKLLPGEWVIFLCIALYNWSDSMWQLVDQLEPIHDHFTVEDAPPDQTIMLDHAFSVLTVSGLIEFRDQKNAGAELGRHLGVISKLSEPLDTKVAHDFATFAVIAFNSAAEIMTEALEAEAEVAEEQQIRLAIGGGKPEQLAAARLGAANGAIRRANRGLTLREAAYRAVERAVEALLHMPDGPVREELVASFMADLQPNRWVQTATLSLLVANQPSLRNEFIQSHGVDPLLTRLNRFANTEGVAQFLQGLTMHGFSTLQMYERERMALEKLPLPETLTVDWTEWRVDHHAYRRAIPQSRSFLREEDFPRNLAYYVHEITHVLSVSRQIGFTLYTMRVWILALEMIIGGFIQSDTDTLYSDPLPRGDLRLLPMVQHQLAIAERMQILQDVWAPWFEGLAVFAESAGIPADDPRGITLVMAALRGLVDPIAQEGKETDETYLSYYAQFERMASEALLKTGPTRLYELFFSNANASIYASGYAAVRRVVAYLRAKATGPRSGAELFTVLLSATQYSISSALPPLDVPLEEYELEARQRMAVWIRSLATLSAEDIALIVDRPDDFSPSHPVLWEDGRPKLAKDLAPGMDIEVASRSWELMSNAILRICEPDVTPPAAKERQAKEFEAAIRAKSGMLLKQYFLDDGGSTLRDAQLQMAEAGYLLPVGSVTCSFLLAINEAAGIGHLCVALVTTEAHKDTREPSFNLLMLPLPIVEIEQVTEIYERTRDPHIRVSRIIDFVGLARSELADTLGHYLVFQYHDWSWIAPAALGLEAFDDEDQRKHFLRIATKRLGASRSSDVHVAISRLADRAAKWLATGASWRAGDLRTELSEWEAAIQAQIIRLGSMEQRRARLTAASQDMLNAVGLATPLVNALSTEGFAGLTDYARHQRDGFVAFLIATSRNPANAGAPPPLPPDLAKLFRRSAAGWDF